MKSSFRSVVSALTILLALAFAAGCGDDDSTGGSISSDTDPQEVLDTALGSEQTIDSGVLDLSFELTSSASEEGTITASLTGPFQSGGEEGSLPEVDLTASASANAAGTSFDFEGGLTITPDAAFVSYNGEDYMLDDATFAIVEQSYEESSAAQAEAGEAGSLAQFGVDPASWVTDLTNEGTEDLDGTEVVHVSGTGDVTAIVEDLTAVAEQTGQAGQLDAAQLSQFEELVESASIDVFANAENDGLRQLDLNMEITDPAGEGTATLAFSIGIADPNAEQEITAPTDARPLGDLLEQIPGGVGALGELGALGGATGSSDAPSGAAAAGDYYDCVAQAQSATDLEACGTP